MAGAYQANLRIIDATQRRMGLPAEKVMINIQKYGNTTAATIPFVCAIGNISSKRATTSSSLPSVEDLRGEPHSVGVQQLTPPDPYSNRPIKTAYLGL